MSGFDKERVLALIDDVELVHCDGRGPQGWVYFIVCNDTGRCKIGFTKGNPAKRLKNLQTGSPGELSLVLMQPGTPDTEARLHEKFADSNVRGEWFEITDELRAYMVAALWAMAEITLRNGRKLEPWMAIGLKHTIENLECISESLSDLLEADPA